MPSDPSLLAGMQNLTICWWTLWFLTNLLVDTPSNKILISRCCGERRAVKCPICPCPFFYTSFFFPICSEQRRVLPSPSPSSTSAPQCHRRRRLCPSSEPHRVLPPPPSNTLAKQGHHRHGHRGCCCWGGAATQASSPRPPHPCGPSLHPPAAPALARSVHPARAVSELRRH